MDAVDILDRAVQARRANVPPISEPVPGLSSEQNLRRESVLLSREFARRMKAKDVPTVPYIYAHPHDSWRKRRSAFRVQGWLVLESATFSRPGEDERGRFVQVKTHPGAFVDVNGGVQSVSHGQFSDKAVYGFDTIPVLGSGPVFVSPEHLAAALGYYGVH